MRRASEQDRPDVARARAAWRRELAAPGAGDRLYLDEFGAKTNLSRTHGWAASGQRVVGAVPAGHWKSTSTIAALSRTGVHPAAWCLDGAVDAAAFRAFVEGALAPTLGPGQVVVMDNLSAHKASGVREAIEARGAAVRYLPAYSPDLNPIEMAFSKAKGRLRDAAQRTREGVVAAIGEALSSVTADDARGYFRHVGHVLR